MKDYNEAFHDIPGTTVFDAVQSRRGFHLNQFCMSLMKAANRAAFKADEAGYLAGFPMTEAQRDAFRQVLLLAARALEAAGQSPRVSALFPAVLLSGHLEGEVPILVYRVADYRATVAGLRARGLTALHEIEIPHGPLASFEAAGGQRLAVYELTRPEAAGKFDGIVDEPQ